MPEDSSFWGSESEAAWELAEQDGERASSLHPKAR